jgi:quinolinate synthase
MKKTTLELVAGALEGTSGQTVTVPEEIAVKARKSLEKMIEMSA